MKTSHRRIALLTGASLATLGFASPAFAAPHYPGAAPHDAASAAGTHAGTSNTYAAGTAQDVISICAIADNPACFLGVNKQGAGAQSCDRQLFPDGPDRPLRSGGDQCGRPFRDRRRDGIG